MNVSVSLGKHFILSIISVRSSYDFSGDPKRIDKSYRAVGNPKYLECFSYGRGHMRIIAVFSTPPSTIISINQPIDSHPVLSLQEHCCAIYPSKGVLVTGIKLIFIMLHKIKLHSQQSRKCERPSLAKQQIPNYSQDALHTAGTNTSYLQLSHFGVKWPENFQSPIVIALASGRDQASYGSQCTPHETRVSFHYGFPLVIHKTP